MNSALVRVIGVSFALLRSPVCRDHAYERAACTRAWNCVEGVRMIGRRLWLAGAAAAVALVVAGSAPAEGAGHPATGVGSCTLKGWNPASDPANAKDLPIGKRPQTYRPDNYNCAGAI